MISYRTTTPTLIDLGQASNAAYLSNDPFPHIVINDFFDPAVLERVRVEAEAVDPALSYAKFSASKMQKEKFAFLPDVVGEETNRLVSFLNSGPVLGWLEQLTGIQNLLVDPSFFGAGLHRIQAGGFLEVHADFNHLKRYDLERRINLLLYLNKAWQPEHNGSLQLWDRRSAVKSIGPVFNRCVIFSTTKSSLHGHPEPFSPPLGMSRHSIALYYYTNTWDPTGQALNTQYYVSPDSGAKVRSGRIARDFVMDLIPPIFRKGARALKRLVNGEKLKEM